VQKTKQLHSIGVRKSVVFRNE